MSCEFQTEEASRMKTCANNTSTVYSADRSRFSDDDDDVAANAAANNNHNCNRYIIVPRDPQR